MTSLRLSAALFLLSSLLSGGIAFAPTVTKSETTTTVFAEQTGNVGRRNFLVSAAAVIPATSVLVQNAFASETTTLIEEVEVTRQKLDPIPAGKLQPVSDGLLDHYRNDLRSSIESEE